MKETLYSRRSNLVVGFHGCDQSIANKIIEGKDDLIASTNDYDWLGHGIYFWENNELRALQYANDMMGRAHSSVKCPAVIGAIIDLGYCMDLTDSLYLGELKESYNVLVETCRVTGISLPTNSTIGISEDKLLRREFDSVKGVFWEGVELYPDAGFREKNHIQICVRNPNCIKGFFLPRKLDMNYINP